MALIGNAIFVSHARSFFFCPTSPTVLSIQMTTRNSDSLPRGYVSFAETFVNRKLDLEIVEGERAERPA